MRISIITCYAMELLVCLAERGNEHPSSASELAECTGVSDRFTQRIMRLLQLAGIVRSVRGIAGGFLLDMVPDEISVAKVMQAVEGKLTLPEKARSVTAGLAVAVLEKAAEEIKASLEKITLEEACNSCRASPAANSDSESSPEAPAEVTHGRKTCSLGRQRCFKPRATSRNLGKK